VSFGVYGTPCSPDGKDAGPMPKAGLIVIVYARAGPLTTPSLAVIEKLNILAVVGVPLIVAVVEAPVPLLSDKPLGNAPFETFHVQHVGGKTVSLAVRVWL
jgi:hypothetical protein